MIIIGLYINVARVEFNFWKKNQMDILKEMSKYGWNGGVGMNGEM